MKYLVVLGGIVAGATVGYALGDLLGWVGILISFPVCFGVGVLLVKAFPVD